MKNVDLLRHCDNDDDRLTTKGIEHALSIGGRLPGPYQIAVSSGKQRATQTIACILAGGGMSVAEGVWVDERFHSSDPARWQGINAEKGAVHLEEFLAFDRDFVVREAKVMGQALRDLLDRLSDGGRALIVGHGPTQETAVYGLTGVLIPALKKGAGVSVEEVDGDYKVASLPLSPSV